MLRAVVESGGQAVLVTADGGLGVTPAEGVVRIDLAHEEARWGPNALLSFDPRRVLARRGSPTQRPAPLWRRWSTSRPYGAVRYWVLWRVLSRHLDQVRPADITHVVIVGIESWPITWHITRGRNDVDVGFNLPKSLLGVQPLEGDA